MLWQLGLSQPSTAGWQDDETGTGDGQPDTIDGTEVVNAWASQENSCQAKHTNARPHKGDDICCKGGFLLDFLGVRGLNHKVRPGYLLLGQEEANADKRSRQRCRVQHDAEVGYGCHEASGDDPWRPPIPHDAE